MRYNVSLPWWAYAVMGLGLAVFIGLVGLSIRRNHGIKRSLFSAPYTMWMILFTILPCILIAYYAFTDTAGNFTLDNFRTFWDSNSEMKKLVASSTPCGWPSCAPSFPCFSATRPPSLWRTAR